MPGAKERLFKSEQLPPYCGGITQLTRMRPPIRSRVNGAPVMAARLS